MSEGRYRLIGSTASPYAIKLRALLRYRRIPFDWLIMTKALRAATAHLRPMLIPVLQYPDGTYRGETTMLAYDLEARHHGRSVIPEDKAVAFVCDLLEDLASLSHRVASSVYASTPVKISIPDGRATRSRIARPPDRPSRTTRRVDGGGRRGARS